MKIKIDVLDRDSVASAIDKLNLYSKGIDDKISQIIEILTKLGTEIVEYSYSLSLEEYDVSCQVKGNSSMIMAEGDNVIFLEFGTGSYTEDHTDDMETFGLPPIFGGSWSATEGSGVYARYGHWHYKGVDYQGTNPTRGFYFASKEIKEQAVNIAKRIFKK